MGSEQACVLSGARDGAWGGSVKDGGAARLVEEAPLVLQPPQQLRRTRVGQGVHPLARARGCADVLPEQREAALVAERADDEREDARDALVVLERQRREPVRQQACERRFGRISGRGQQAALTYTCSVRSDRAY